MILPFIFLAIGVCFHLVSHGSNLSWCCVKSHHQKLNVLKASHAIFARSDIFHPILWHHCCHGNYWLAAFAFAATGDLFLAMVMGADNDGLAGNDLWNHFTY